MKRFLALALIFILALTAVSCNQQEEEGDSVGETSSKILAMYNRKSPTKSVTEAKYTFVDMTLVDSTTLISGRVDGTKVAAKLKQVKQRLRSVEDGSNAIVVGPIEETTTYKEFYEGRGVRTKINNGVWGAWDLSASNFAPTEGSISLNITDSKITNISEDGKKISFTVPTANTADVLGKAINSDVAVTVIHDGACIVGLELSYVEAKTDSIPETFVDIKVEYTYDIEKITIGAE